jgi:guanylate kinase
VYVFNLALEDTIEEYVLEKLYHKIDLFSQSIGELSEILTRLEDSGMNFEDEVFDRLVNAGNAVELENDFDAMAVNLQEQRDLANKVSDFNTGVFDGFDLGASDD